MSANRLMRLSITIFVAFLAAWALVAYFNWDAARTQTCINRGNSPEVCGWR